jgi:tetraacyldisaccharide 4'-kinase
VISIGNLAAGGRAKTPIAALAAIALRDAGERPAILSRGYGRRRVEDGVVVVRDPEGIRADLDRSGDEPLMLARALEGVAVLVSSSRFLAGRLAESQLGCTVHVLDDGFQHFDLRRTADLVVVTREEFDRPVTLPSGRLREPLDAGAAADAFVALRLAPPMGSAVREPGQAGADERLVGGLRGLAPGKPIFVAERRLTGVPSTDRVLAVAGIASPSSFFAELRGAGWNVAAELPFPDHHRYSRDDVERMTTRGREAGATRIVTTEKDYVRLLPFRPFPVAVEAVPLAIDFDDRASFVSWLLSVVKGTPA